MEIYLLRHGKTDWNKDLKLQGSSDIPLNAEGIKEAKKAAKYFRKTKFDYIFSSPLSRAVDTATIIGNDQNKGVKIDSRLIELCFGDLEGKTMEEVRANKDWYAVFDDPENFVPVGDGESFDDLNNRCKDFLDYLISCYGDANRVLIVAHGATCKGLRRAMLGYEKSDFWSLPPQPNCTAMVFEYKDGKYSVIKEAPVKDTGYVK